MHTHLVWLSKRSGRSTALYISMYMCSLWSVTVYLRVCFLDCGRGEGQGWGEGTSSTGNCRKVGRHSYTNVCVCVCLAVCVKCMIIMWLCY